MPSRHGPDRPEIRRHLGRPHRAHPQRRQARRALSPRGTSARRRRVGDGGRDQSAARRSRRSCRPNPDPRELDVVAATGEQVTIGLLAIALHELGLKARSYTGGAGAHPHRQRVHQGAHPRDRRASGCARTSTAGTIVIVAGFQGVDADGNITTLGRGRVGHVGRRARRGAEGRRVPDLHRRRRRLHDRSAHRPRGAPARHDHVRGDARAGEPGLEGAADPLGRVRGQVQGASCACCRRSRIPNRIARAR